VGTWGEGNFDSDSALDWIGNAITDPIIATIEQSMPEHEPQNGEAIMAAVEMMSPR
jgi:hypothetical protein